MAMAIDAQTEARLFPPSYGYAYWVQYGCLLVGILLTSHLIVNVVIGLFGYLGGERWSVFGGRELTDVVGAVAAFSLAGMGYQYRRKIRNEIGKWTRFSFKEPISIETPIQNSTGEMVECRFVVDIDLWFETKSAAEEARVLEDKIVLVLQTLMEEASRDPVARRSKTHFHEFLEAVFTLPKVARIDVKSTDFKPVPVQPPS